MNERIAPAHEQRLADGLRLVGILLKDSRPGGDEAISGVEQSTFMLWERFRL